MKETEAALQEVVHNVQVCLELLKDTGETAEKRDHRAADVAVEGDRESVFSLL